MSKPEERQNTTVETERPSVPLRRRLGRAVRALWRAAIRVVRLPIDLVVLSLHVVFINFWKARWYRRTFKRGCQCFIAGDERSFCSPSYWYGSPELVHLLCGQVRTCEQSPTGHARCTGERGATPIYYLRSLATVALLCACLAAAAFPAWKLLPRVRNRLRGTTPIALELQRAPEYLATGKKQFEAGNYADASAAFRKVIGLKNRDPEAFTCLGLTAEAQGDPKLAFQAYTRATQLDPKDGTATVRLAWIYLTQNDLDKAESLAKLALGDEKNAGMANALLAAVAATRKKNDEARTYLAAAVKSDPRSPLARYVHGVISLADGKEKDAIESFTGLLDDRDIGQRAGLTLADVYVRNKDFANAEKVLKKNAGNTKSYIPQLHLIRLYFVSGQKQRALDEAHKLAESVQGERVYTEQLARILFKAGQADEAVSMAMAGLKQFPESLPLHEIAATVFYTHKLYQQAQKYCADALLLNKNARWANIIQGKIYMQQGQPDKAANAFGDAIQLNQKDAEAYYLLGESLLQSREPARAIQAYENAIKLAPEAARAYCGKALALGELGKWKESRTSCEEALRRQPAFPEAVVHLGTTYYKLGDRKKAQECYRQVLEQWPTHPAAVSAANNLAWILAETNGDLKEAVTLATRAVKMTKGHPNYVHTLAWVKYKSGDAKGAAPLLARAIQLRPNNADFHYHYGVILAALNRNDEAIEQLEKYLPLAPAGAKTAEARKLLDKLRAVKKP